MKQVLPFLLLTLVAVASPPIQAIDPNPSGQLGAYVAISGDPKFLQEWIKNAPSPGITIRRIKEIQIGQTAYIGFIVTGHRSGKDKKPNIEIDVTVRTPDGAVLMDERAYARVRYKTGEGGFVMGDPALDITFEPGDPIGLWQIEARVRDQIAKTTATGFSTINVHE